MENIGSHFMHTVTFNRVLFLVRRHKIQIELLSVWRLAGDYKCKYLSYQFFRSFALRNDDEKIMKITGTREDKSRTMRIC